MSKRPLNPRWELAAQIAREMGNETNQNILRLLKEFQSIEKEGYTLEIAVSCWRWLKTREEFPITEARLITCLKGSPVYIEQFKACLVEEIPAVFDATAHDEYVMEHGKILKSLGFQYRVENQPGRLTTEKLIQCGLKENNE